MALVLETLRIFGRSVSAGSSTHTIAFAAIALLTLVIYHLSGGRGSELGVFTTALILAAAFSGVIHGALDLWISKDAGLWSNRRSFTVFHILYVLLALLVAGFFVAAPALSLILFIGASVCHFADDWDSVLPASLRILGALLLILITTASHPDDVSFLFGLMTGESNQAVGVITAEFTMPIIWLTVGTLTAAFIKNVQAGIEITAIACLAYFTPPAITFSIYFACMHSPRHIMRHHKLITSGTQRAVLAIYGLAAICLMIGLASFVGGMSPLSGVDDVTFWFRTLFIGLAALTLPHIVLLRIAKSRRGKSTIDAPSADLSHYN